MERQAFLLLYERADGGNGGRSFTRLLSTARNNPAAFAMRVDIRGRALLTFQLDRRANYLPAGIRRRVAWIR